MGYATLGAGDVAVLSLTTFIMRILSNGFPTNLPDSENISQGGPANFARLFINYILTSGAEHHWVGVMLEGVLSNDTVLEQVYSSTYRSYYRLQMPKASLASVLQAESVVDPRTVWAEPISVLSRFIQEQKPDVVFLNGFGILNWMLLQAADKNGVPVVTQHAGIWTKELGIHKDRYSKIGRALLEQTERDSTRMSAVEIFLNQWSKEYYQEHVAQGDERKMEIVPLPFDFASFNQLSTTDAPSRFDFDTKTFHIGVIARWDEIKNHKALLAMAKAAHAAKLPWRFHSVVDIPEKYADERREYEQYVDVVPPLDRAGISDFCRSVDLLLLPSLFDVSPTVVLEAVALDTPIAISPTIGYVSDFIKYGAEAWVINPEDANAALKAIERIMYKNMPFALRKRLLDIHDHKKVFATYLEIFTSAKLRGLSMGKVVQILLGESIAQFVPGSNSNPHKPTDR